MSWCNPNVRTPFCQDVKCPACSPHRPPGSTENVFQLHAANQHHSPETVAKNLLARVMDETKPKVRSVYVVLVDESNHPHNFMSGSLSDYCFGLKYLDALADKFLGLPEKI